MEVMYGEGDSAAVVGRRQLPLKAMVGSGVRPAGTVGALVGAARVARDTVVGSGASGSHGSDVCTAATGGGLGALLVACPGGAPIRTGVGVGVLVGVGQGASVGNAAVVGVARVVAMIREAGGVLVGAELGANRLMSTAPIAAAQMRPIQARTTTAAMISGKRLPRGACAAGGGGVGGFICVSCLDQFHDLVQIGRASC